MPSLEEIISILRELKPEISERYKVSDIWLFGSYARGEQEKASDLDILVDFRNDADLFDLVGLELFLEQELQINVDVVPKKSLRSEIRDAVLKEVVSL